jgi:hypothetical protein
VITLALITLFGFTLFCKAENGPTHRTKGREWERHAEGRYRAQQ